MPSINAMVKRIEGLSGTNDVTEWEDDFIDSVVEKTDHGKDVSRLSDKQLETVQRIFNKHFAG